MKTLKNTYVSDCCKASYKWRDETSGTCDKCKQECDIIFINSKGQVELI